MTLTHQALPFFLLPGLLLCFQLHHRQGRPNHRARESTGRKAGQQAQPALLQAWRKGLFPSTQPIATNAFLFLSKFLLPTPTKLLLPLHLQDAARESP